jgi:hypothetical protein
MQKQYLRFNQNSLVKLSDGEGKHVVSTILLKFDAALIVKLEKVNVGQTPSRHNHNQYGKGNHAVSTSLDNSIQH